MIPTVEDALGTDVKGASDVTYAKQDQNDE
jgi:hypothetical protein